MNFHSFTNLKDFICILQICLNHMNINIKLGNIIKDNNNKLNNLNCSTNKYLIFTISVYKYF